MRIAMIGTRGVPARYGGFETCVEEVGRRLVLAGHDVVVYCRTVKGGEPADRLDSYEGMQLVHLPAVRSRVAETLSHTALSVVHLVLRRADVALVFNAANSPLLPVVRAARIPVATHVDGLEWKRAKWGGNGRRYYRLAESLAVRWSDALIADAQGIADYYRTEFDADTDLIAYGAPQVDPGAHDRLAELDLRPDAYHLVVARFEAENHVDVIVRGYVDSSALLPLIVVGSAPYADEHTALIHEIGADARVRFLGGVWDQQLLDQFYANARTYLHGHSVGGTNPSLLRAIGAGTATVAFDVSFNREVLGNAGRYFTNSDDVARAVEDAEADPDGTSVRGNALRIRSLDYNWDDVARRYEALCDRLRARSGRRLSSRRIAPSAQVKAKFRAAPTHKVGSE